MIAAVVVRVLVKTLAVVIITVVAVSKVQAVSLTLIDRRPSQGETGPPP